MLRTTSPQNSEMAGMIINHTVIEPTQMIAAYFKPTIYPNPNTAAPVFILKTSFAFSAIVSPKPIQRLVKFSFHQPKVATMKSYKPPIIPANRRGLA